MTELNVRIDNDTTCRKINPIVTALLSAVQWCKSSNFLPFQCITCRCCVVKGRWIDIESNLEMQKQYYTLWVSLLWNLFLLLEQINISAS